MPISGKDRGFTLIELLVVVTVLSVLAAVAIPRYLQYINRSRAITTLASVKDALKMLAIDTDLWPGGNTPYVCPKNLTPSQNGLEYNDLTANDIGLFNNNGTVFSGPLWDGPYLPASYLDPSTNKFLDPWGTPYWMDYDYDIGGNWYVAVVSSGPNRSGINVYDSDNIVVILGE